MICNLKKSEMSFISGMACQCFCNHSRFIGIAQDLASCDLWCIEQQGLGAENNACVSLHKGDLVGYVISLFSGPSRSKLDRLLTESKKL